MTPVVSGSPGIAQSAAGTNYLHGIACPSSTTCYAVGVDTSHATGAFVVISSGQPGTGQSVAGTGYLEGIACPSGSACFAAGQDFSNAGVIVPVNAGSPDRTQRVPGTRFLFDSTCATNASCVAVGGNSSAGVIVPVSTGPTAARVTRFTASRDRASAQVTFRWRVAVSTAVAGFNLYDGHTRINSRLSPVHAARAYRYVTRWTGGGPFQLQVLFQDGSKRVAPDQAHERIV